MSLSQSESETSHQHGKPTEGMMCLCTMEDITEEDANYVEYQSYPSLEWKPSLFEAVVIDQLLDTQFNQFLERVKTTDCQAELRRLLKNGPPTYISDATALPLAQDSDTHICHLWFARSPSAEVTARLKGAPETEEERLALWEELKKFIIVEGKEEGDEDENAEKN